MSSWSPAFAQTYAGRRPLSVADEPSREETADQFQLVTDVPHLLELENDWNILADRVAGDGNPFLSFNWHRHWCRHFLSIGKRDARQSLCIVVGRRDGRVRTIWPLVLHRELGLRLLRFMGEPVSQYGDVLVEDGPEALARLQGCWEFLRQEVAPDAFVARKVRADSAIARLLEGLGATETERQRAPFADLSSLPDADAFQLRFSKKFRRNCRRQSNRLKELGALDFRVYRESSEARGLVGEAIELKRQWLREHGHIAPSISDDRFKAFFEDIAGATDRPAGCLVSALTLDGCPIAIEVGILRNGHYAAHIGTFDMRYGKLSPGNLQMQQTIWHLIESGVERYDLMAPQSDYKMTWADAAVDVRDYVVPDTIGGGIYANVYLKRLRPRLRNGLFAISDAKNKLMAML